MTGHELKNALLLFFSGIGGFLMKFLGGWDAALKCLLAFMVIDYITGVVCAIVFKKSTKTKNGGISSDAGFKGIVKKLCILCLVCVAVCIDNISKTDYIRNITVLFFTSNEGLTILENVGNMGVSYPEPIKTALQIMKKTNKKDE